MAKGKRFSRSIRIIVSMTKESKTLEIYPVKPRGKAFIRKLFPSSGLVGTVVVEYLRDGGVLVKLP